MSSNQNTNNQPTNATAADKDKQPPQVDLLSTAVANAAANAGKPSFNDDMQRLEKMLNAAAARHKQPLSEIALEAAVYTGVAGLLVVGTLLLIRFIGGSSDSTASN